MILPPPGTKRKGNKPLLLPPLGSLINAAAPTRDCGTAVPRYKRERCNYRVNLALKLGHLLGGVVDNVPQIPGSASRWDGIDRPVVGQLLYVTEGGRYHHEHNRPRYDQRLILVEQVVSLTRQPTTHSHWGTA